MIPLATAMYCFPHHCKLFSDPTMFVSVTGKGRPLMAALWLVES